MEIVAASEIPWDELIKAILAIMLAWIAYKQAIQTRQIAVVTEKVEEVHIATNSMKDELVKKTEEEALARGGVEERARADARHESSTGEVSSGTHEIEGTIELTPKDKES